MKETEETPATPAIPTCGTSYDVPVHGFPRLDFFSTEDMEVQSVNEVTAALLAKEIEVDEDSVGQYVLFSRSLHTHKHPPVNVMAACSITCIRPTIQAFELAGVMAGWPLRRTTRARGVRDRPRIRGSSSC